VKITAELSTALAGRYAVEREIGRGGMAVVYLARDTKHDRLVAVKVLNPELGAMLGAERFLSEIKTTATLQHPNLLPLFDSGEANGLLYYVMPYLDGESLRARLVREQQLPIEDAVRIATGIANALSYAHARGVIHRDLKPENVLLQHGQPVVLDFGVALAVRNAAEGRKTQTGMSVGTPQYMSPEQAAGEKVIDSRADIYALGALTYEMLAGDPPHTGPSAQVIVSRVMAGDIRPVTVARPSVPAHVANAVHRALARVPADRFATAVEFAQALVVSAPALPTAATAQLPAARADWRRRVAVPALALAGVFAMMAAWAFSRPEPTPPVSRYRVELPQGQRIGDLPWGALAVSPDGSRLVYAGENRRLFVRSRDQLAPAELPGTDLAFNPFFSPDGSRLGFMSGQPGRGEIRAMSLSGGPPVTVTTTDVGGPGATWGYDGFIYYDASGVAPLRRVSENGGQSEVVSTLDAAAGELQHVWPDALPNKRGVLMTINRGGPGVNVSRSDDIAVLDLATRRHKVLVRGVYARYAASGHILYVTADGVLMGVRFDQDRLEITGAPVALLEGVNIRPVGGGVDMTISRSGTLWYGTGVSMSRQRRIFWAARDGAFSEVDPAWTGDFESLAISPDGTQLAVSIAEGGSEHIWVKRLGRLPGPISKLTHERSNTAPRWDSAGRRVLFASRYSAESDLRATLADASGPPTILRSDVFITDGRWSPDGRWLIYGGRAPSMRVFREDIFGIRPGRDSAPVPLAATDFSERNGSVSPNGRWLLFEANPTGRYEVYVRPFPNTSASLTQVSTGGGTVPEWSRDGREIFYANGKSELARVAVRPGAPFAVGEPSTLFSLDRVADWDVAPDGRIIMIRALEGEQASQLVVVENFFQELRQKANGAAAPTSSAR